MNETVRYDVDGAIATITLCRPERLNAMNVALIEGALEAIEAAASDDAVRAVVLTGAGRGFCAGGDLSGADLLDRKAPVAAQTRELRRGMTSSQLLQEMPKLTIAAINGPCAGAGLAWACACDLRYAAASATFTTAFLKAGLSGDFGGTWTLPRIVGSAKARELYLLSDRFDAAEAERIGLVGRVLPDAELLPFVRGVAERAAGAAPLALRWMKANLNDASRLSLSETLDREAERQVRTSLSDDAVEAARAFFEKRTPRFRGR